ncbi:hypothetical protein EIP91_003337 [Steccherinum ochraceum]|uniref:Uncharacterized protein n=1 Tax=Steccherinum ochraceum TaxID=92696 RepID=A0A4R0RD91_9APHY|nr:hypothetical protein EIP91_003337 [Steccherinum ochraceum]
MFRSTKATSSSSSLASTATYATASPTPQKTQKDFSSAFASLQGDYGFLGGVPMRPAAPTTPSSSKPRGTPPAFAKQPPVKTGTKDFEASFATLSSTYGFGGGVQCTPRTRTPGAGRPGESSQWR